MSAKARLEATITGNEQPFVAAVNRAEKHAQSFSGRLQGMFKRDPSRKASHALSGFIGDLATGDVSTAIAGISGKIGGLGLAIGVGIGAGVMIFEKFKEQVEATEKATRDLRDELDRPLSLQSALGPEGISGEIDRASKKMENLKEQRKGIFSRISEFVESHVAPGPGWGKVDMGGHSTEAGRVNREEEDRLKELNEARSTAEIAVVNIRRTGFYISEQEAELEKIKLDAAKKRAQLYLERGLTKPGRDATQLFRSITAVNEDQKLSEAQVNKKADDKQQELTLENQILNLKVSGLTKDEQSLAILKLRTDELQKQLSEPGTKEEKQAIRTKINTLDSEKLQQQYKNRFEGPALWTPEKGEAGKFKSWVRSQTPSTEGAYITNPDAYDRSPDAYGGANDAAIPQRGMPHSWANFDKAFPLKPEEYASAPVTPSEENRDMKDQQERPMTKDEMDALLQKYWGE